VSLGTCNIPSLLTLAQDQVSEWKLPGSSFTHFYSQLSDIVFGVSMTQSVYHMPLPFFPTFFRLHLSLRGADVARTFGLFIRFRVASTRPQRGHGKPRQNVQVKMILFSLIFSLQCDQHFAFVCDRVWDLRSPRKSCAVLLGNMGAIRSLRYNHTGTVLAMCEAADFVHLLDVNQNYTHKQVIDVFGETRLLFFMCVFALL
jgi:hypothetical protein